LQYLKQLIIIFHQHCSDSLEPRLLRRSTAAAWERAVPSSKDVQRLWCQCPQMSAMHKSVQTQQLRVGPRRFAPQQEPPVKDKVGNRGRLGGTTCQWRKIFASANARETPTATAYLGVCPKATFCLGTIWSQQLIQSGCLSCQMIARLSKSNPVPKTCPLTCTSFH
jgi:hypothetical protein